MAFGGQEHDQVVVWANSVGPYANRQETYDYFQLPFCAGNKNVQHEHHESLAEELLGMNLVNTGIDITFLDAVQNKSVCKKFLSEKDVSIFRYAISQYYWYQMYLDDLTIYGYVGEIDETKSGNPPALYLHRDFKIDYNGKQIIDVKIETSKPYPLPGDKKDFEVEFTYSVTWVRTDQPFSKRYKNYVGFFEHKIHWFSIFNSFMMVVFLLGLVVVILLRTLKRDLARYDKEQSLLELERDFGDEYGWKQVHGDVFRPPRHLTFLSAVLGTGFQLAILGLSVILYALSGEIYVEQARTLSASLFLYAVTSIIAGYYTGSFYTKYGGKNWVRLIFVTAALWPGIVSSMVVSINFVAIAKASSRAIPFGSMVAVICIWLFCVFPLVLIGVILGRNWSGDPSFPCRINPIPRPIPDKVWYAEPVAIVCFGGVLPFASVFIEMYFVFTSFWQYKIYYMFGFMLLVFLILIIATACVSIVSTYFLLNSENHRWNWIAFLASGSTAGYVFLYSFYYFFARTK
ncbi:hypothetical protein HK101_011647 [Irineochytrium annulatum]|nr:hypothetical protein HK101_011647 [Irineochytrium annulatum]